MVSKKIISLIPIINNVAISMKQWRDARNLLLLRNDFKIDQYVLVLVKGFIILFKILK